MTTNKPYTWTLSGDVLCRYCGFESHAAIVISAPLPDTPYTIACECCSREGATFLPDYVLAPLDPASDTLVDEGL